MCFSHRSARGNVKRTAHVDACFSSILFTFFLFPKPTDHRRRSRCRIRSKKKRDTVRKVFQFFFFLRFLILCRFVPPPFSSNGGTHDRRRTVHVHEKTRRGENEWSRNDGKKRGNGEKNRDTTRNGRNGARREHPPTGHRGFYPEILYC